MIWRALWRTLLGQVDKMFFVCFPEAAHREVCSMPPLQQSSSWAAQFGLQTVFQSSAWESVIGPFPERAGGAPFSAEPPNPLTDVHLDSGEYLPLQKTHVKPFVKFTVLSASTRAPAL